MKKIIAAFDGLKYAASTRDYAIHITKETNAHIVGVFLEDFTYNSYGYYDLTEPDGGISQAKRKQLLQKDVDTRIAAVKDFEKKCQQAKLNFSIHRDRQFAMKDLLHECNYADLLIINSKETFDRSKENLPTQFIKDLLSEVLCPVLVVPATYKSINNISILYDGEPASVYATKMFSYLFGPLKLLPTKVISVKNNLQHLHLPNNHLMKEFMKRHFPHATYKVLKGLPENEIISYLKTEATQTVIVTGAYKRGIVSRWFRQSMADLLMKTLKFPIFIAHNGK